MNVGSEDVVKRSFKPTRMLGWTRKTLLGPRQLENGPQLSLSLNLNRWFSTLVSVFSLSEDLIFSTGSLESIDQVWRASNSAGRGALI